MADQSLPSPAENSDRVQELTWALLDEQIGDDEFNELNRTLLRDDKSRDSYLSCIQMHAELMVHLGAPKNGASNRKNAPIVGLDLPPLGFQTGATEELAS